MLTVYLAVGQIWSLFSIFFFQNCNLGTIFSEFIVLFCGKNSYPPYPKHYFIWMQPRIFYSSKKERREEKIRTEKWEKEKKERKKKKITSRKRLFLCRM